MTTPTVDQLLAEYDAWAAHRAAAFQHEAEHGRFPDGDLFASDDEGCELAHALADALRRDALFVAAAQAVVDLDPGCWYDQATAFTCTEADALADLLRAAGHTNTAAVFIEAHAEGDDEGDDHYDADAAMADAEADR